MTKRKQSATAEQTPPRKTRHATAIEAAPMLSFRRHVGSTSHIQPRTVAPRSTQAADKIKLSDFPYTWEQSQDHAIVRSFVAGFQIIENDKAWVLADELVNFLVTTWSQDHRRGSEICLTPKEHRFYDILTSKDKSIKSLNYGHWMYLATWWGPGHPDLEAIRNDMSALWGVEFPTDAMFYPSNLSQEDQKMLYLDIRPVLEDEESGSPGGHSTPQPRVASRPNASAQPPETSQSQLLPPSISQPLDTKMKVRQQEIVNAIENNPVGSDIGKLVPNIKPKFLKPAAPANDSTLGKLRSDLKATQKELQASQTKATVLGENLDKLEDEKTQLVGRVNNLERDLDRSKVKANNLEGKLNEAGYRMDALERKLEEANERAKKGIEMSAFNHTLIEERLKEEPPEEDDEDNGDNEDHEGNDENRGRDFFGAQEWVPGSGW